MKKHYSTFSLHFLTRYLDFYSEEPQPGSILGHKCGAILVATVDEDKALWITHLKPKPGAKFMKNKVNTN